jgi:hypothetical protein
VVSTSKVYTCTNVVDKHGAATATHAALHAHSTTVASTVSATRWEASTESTAAGWSLIPLEAWLGLAILMNKVS